MQSITIWKVSSVLATLLVAQTAGAGLISGVPSGSSGLLAYYPFNADATDSSGSGKNGTNNGSVTFASAGVYGNAASFNGTSNYVSTPLISTLGLQNSSTWTFAAWIKTTNTTSISGSSIQYQNPTIMGFGTSSGGSRDVEFQLNAGYVGYYHGMAASTTDQFYYFTAANSPKAFVADGNWHQVTLTDNGSRLSLYVDGTQLTGDTSTTWTVAENIGATGTGIATTGQSNDSALGIDGTVGVLGTTLVGGSIDEVGIWNRALSGSDIAYLAAVPEPSSLWLLSIGVALYSFFRHRGRE